MLDEDEFAVVSRLYSECFSATKSERQAEDVGLGLSPIDARFEPVRAEFERLTGFANCHHNAVMHHRLSLFGPPCSVCGKPLRTPDARYCAACGALSASSTDAQ